ncbi:MAG TPA: hypothetical protein VGO47_13305 [Chlamydiales bacterium]|jgi:hypothetical protein|nr:hypothetical protein [Chlamydiales bacterium]
MVVVDNHQLLNGLSLFRRKSVKLKVSYTLVFRNRAECQKTMLLEVGEQLRAAEDSSQIATGGGGGVEYIPGGGLGETLLRHHPPLIRSGDHMLVCFRQLDSALICGSSAWNKAYARSGLNKRSWKNDYYTTWKEKQTLVHSA